MTRHHPRRGPTRPEPREVVELQHLRARMPALATAIDLQLATFDLFRRAHSRVPLPPQLDEKRARAQLAEGRPVLRLADVPINWSDFRWVLRETADLLRRFDLLDAGTHLALHHLMRDGHRLEPDVERWFTVALEGGPGARAPEDADDFGEVYARALRPFLARCAELWAPRLDLSTWQRGWCPLCAGGPELAVLTSLGSRVLVCERCLLRWPLTEQTCPWCGEQRTGQHCVLRTPDGQYQLDACDTCKRYLKVCDEGRLGRPALPWVDAVASMPLDAAALQRGYGQ